LAAKIINGSGTITVTAQLHELLPACLQEHFKKTGTVADVATYQASGLRWSARPELADELGNTLAQTDFSGLYNSGSEPLVFSLPFSIECDDYNNDGDTDFTIGQYSTSNGRDYKLFTLRKDGTVEELHIKGYSSLFISDTTGFYSTKLKKIDNVTFKTEYYDNSKGKNIEKVFKWDGKEFIND
jgi:hypothetical protein